VRTGGSFFMDEEQETLKNEAERAKLIPTGTAGEEDKVKLDYSLRELATYVGLETDKMYESKDKLRFLMEWGATKSKSENLTDILYEVKMLRDSLGFNDIGETSINKLYQYIRLTNEQSIHFKQLERIKKEKELLKNVSKS
jgi:hypothetical protein